MSLNTSARKTVQEGDRLLSQKLFEFLGGHINPVIRETLFVKRSEERGVSFLLAINV